jgi:penicillin-binding protein 1A
MARKRRSSNARSTPRARPSKPSAGGFVPALLHFALLAAIWGGILVGLFVGYCAIDLPDIHQITQPQRRPSVTLEADDGSVFARYGDLFGNHVGLDEVPKYLPEAVIAIEDRRFYSHFGVDIFGLFRAAVRNVLAGHVVQGGSTLTQQLAKNLFLSPDRNMKRKVQEMMLALWLEQTYSKQQIITAYLNRVYLGSGTYGVDAAARLYFNKPVAELNLRECAIIAGLLRAPSRYAPTHDAAASLARGKIVLETMVEEGYITEKQKKAAIDYLPPPNKKPGSGGDGRYFADWVQDQTGPLLEDAAQDIIVSTTLDLNLQRAVAHLC